MEFNEIKELIQIIDTSKLRSFELSNNGTFIKMSKNIVEQPVSGGIQNQTYTAEEIKSEPAMVTEVSEQFENGNGTAVKGGNSVTAPIVGTFYASPAPDKPSFVSVGSKVKKGDVLCIIEAMKVMNEVVSDFDGEVTEICAEDGDLVEYGMKLFTIA
ncbi:acetyl-CoA carboxylase biotin carboxyl carrier protein [Anaerotignum faecicola]|nr:acetyl-CoA carboxylase biotin carboxyl carrier protein [Anaerotignum faecicola]